MLKLRMTKGAPERGNSYKLYVNLTFHPAYTFWFCRFLLHLLLVAIMLFPSLADCRVDFVFACLVIFF